MWPSFDVTHLFLIEQCSCTLWAQYHGRNLLWSAPQRWCIIKKALTLTVSDPACQTCRKKWRTRRRRDALKTSTRGPEEKLWRGSNKWRRKGKTRSVGEGRSYASRWKNWSWEKKRYSEHQQTISSVQNHLCRLFFVNKIIFYFSLTGHSSEKGARGSTVAAVGAGEDRGGQVEGGGTEEEVWDRVCEAYSPDDQTKRVVWYFNLLRYFTYGIHVALGVSWSVSIELSWEEEPSKCRKNW